MNKYINSINYLINKKVKNFNHFINVYNILRKWNCSEDICYAGLFYNIYENDPKTDKEVIKNLIGNESENIIRSFEKDKNIISLAIKMSNNYINVIDNYFDQVDIQKHYFYFRDDISWSFHGYGSDFNKWRKFNYPLKFENQIEQDFKFQTEKILNHLNLLKFLELKKAYASANPYGTVHESHIDSYNGITVMYYLNHFWNLDYSGETVFYENDDIIKSIIPKPGRVVVFDGNIRHCARDVRRDFNDLRMVLTFKYDIIIK